MRALALLPFALCACFVSAQETVATERPNIVVIFSDDVGYADLSCYGSATIATPSIDSIGAAGARFTRGYVTSSVCGPSRAGLLTGRYQQRFGAEFNVEPEWHETRGMPASERTIAEGLQEAGYRTSMVGKWHLGYGEAVQPLSNGFDDFFGFLKGARPYTAIEGDELNQLMIGRDPFPETFEYLTTELAHRAVAYVDEHAKKPFFLYFAPNAVHAPLHARKDLLDRVRFDYAHLPYERQRYIAMLWALDESVGMLLEALQRNGVHDNTIVFFVNDNGGAARNASSNGALRGTKATPYEGGIRVPYLVQWPAKIPAGQVIDVPVSSLDVTATAWAAAGVEADSELPLDGVDLMPLLTGETDEPPHETLFWRRGASGAVIEGDWKLLFEPKLRQPSLFDLAEDPGETKDVALANQEQAKKLLALHQAWSATLAAPAWGAASNRLGATLGDTGR